MKSASWIACLAIAGTVACVDFAADQKTFCQGLVCAERVQVCNDGPQIVQVSPVNADAGISPSTPIVVTFSQNVWCTDAGISLMQYTTGYPQQPGLTTCNGSNQAVFTPSSALLAGTQYSASVDVCQVWNDAGIGAPDASWLFTVSQ